MERLADSFGHNARGEMGEALRAVNLIAAALWIPIIAWCLFIFVIIINGSSDGFMPRLSAMENFAMPTKNSMMGPAVMTLRGDMYLPKYPAPHDVERNNQRTIRQWDNIYPRPAPWDTQGPDPRATSINMRKLLAGPKVTPPLERMA